MSNNKTDNIKSPKQEIVNYSKPKSKAYYRLKEAIEFGDGDDATNNIITLSINNIDIQIHKTILVSKCDYFKTALNKKWNPNNANCFELDVDADIVDNIVDYFNDETFCITFENVRKIMHCSTFLGLSDLVDLCKRLWFVRMTNNWSWSNFGIVIDGASDVHFGEYTLELIVKRMDAFLKYHFWSLLEVDKNWKDRWGNKKFKMIKNKIDKKFNFKKYIHVDANADDADPKLQEYLDKYEKDVTFLSNKSFVRLCEMYNETKGNNGMVKNPDLYKNTILLYLGREYRANGHTASLVLFDQLSHFVPWNQLLLCDIKSFKIFARQRPEYFKELLYSLI